MDITSKAWKAAAKHYRQVSDKLGDKLWDASGKIIEARHWARKMKAERDKLKEEYEHIRELYINSDRENQRLRELIKQVEWGCDPHDCCPYCGASDHEFPKQHSPSCPAFGDDGILKE